MLGIKKAFIQASLETKMPFDETAFAVWTACSDAWALGSYGTPPIPYTEMIVNRWKQIVGIY